MKIAMLNITEGGLSGGYKEYLEHTIPGLAFHPDVSKLLVGIPETIDFFGWKEKFPFVKWISLRRQFFPWQPVGSETKVKVAQFNPDVVFIPTGRFLRINRVPVVNMIRNMEPLAYKNEGNPFSEKLRNLFRAELARIAVQNAERTIAVSHYVKDFLGIHLNIPFNQVDVIYHGANQPHRINATKPQVFPESWSGKFLFTAGSIRPARGLEDIIVALNYLEPKYKLHMDGIIIAGDTDAVMSRYRRKKLLSHVVGFTFPFINSLMRPSLHESPKVSRSAASWASL